PGADLVHGAGFQILDFAIAGDAVDAFEMVLVVELVAGSGMDAGDVEGKPHAVAGQQQPGRIPAIGLDEPFAHAGRFEITHDHCSCPCGCLRARPYSAAARGKAPSPASTASNASATMSRPLSRSAGAIVSGQRIFTTSS